MEATYQFIYSLVREQSGLKGLKYFPHFLSLFLLILFFNLSGLVPFSFTASSHIVITFGICPILLTSITRKRVKTSLKFKANFSTKSVVKIPTKVEKVLIWISKNSFLLNISRIYFFVLFTIRGIFATEKPYTFPLIALIIEILHYSKIFQDLEDTIFFYHQGLYLLVGINLCIYDQIGSFFAEIFNNNATLSSTFLIVPGSNNITLKRFLGFKALFIGKTAMTSTGRASIVVGAAVLGGTIINSYFDRNAANIRAQADRNAADIRAQTDRNTATEIEAQKRAYQNFQDARKSYESSYRKRGEKPQWNEQNWTHWSQTK